MAIRCKMLRLVILALLISTPSLAQTSATYSDGTTSATLASTTNPSNLASLKLSNVAGSTFINNDTGGLTFFTNNSGSAAQALNLSAAPIPTATFPGTIIGFSGADGAPTARTLSSHFADQISTKDEGDKCDVVNLFDGSITNGSATLTSATANWTSADIGKTIVIPIPGGTTFISTISGVTNSHTVTLANTASATNVGLEIDYGSDDTSKLNAAVIAASGQASVKIPCQQIISSTIAIAADHFGIEGVNSLNAPEITDESWAQQLATVTSRIIWAGAPNSTMLSYNVFQRGSLWLKPQGEYLKNIVLDAAGVAGMTGISTRSVIRSHFQSVDVVRAKKYGWDIGTTNSANITTWESAFNTFTDCWANDMGTATGTTLGWSIWGDPVKGNFNYNTFIGGGSEIDNGGYVPTISIEASDTNQMFGFTWNGQLVLNSTDSGTRSTWNGTVPSPMTASQATGWQFYQGGGQIVAKADATHNPSNSTQWNSVYGFQSGNGVGLPVIEKGADLFVSAIGDITPGGAVPYGHGHMEYGSLPVMTQVYSTVNQAIPNNAITLLSWNLVTMDELGAWSSSNPTTITVPGGVKWAKVNVQLAWDSNCSGYRQIWIRQNGGLGAVIVEDNPAPNSSCVVNNNLTSRWFPVTPGDTITASAYQTSGTTVNILGGDDRTPFLEVEWK